jgi:hypothetical protein
VYLLALQQHPYVCNNKALWSSSDTKVEQIKCAIVCFTDTKVKDEKEYLEVEMYDEDYSHDEYLLAHRDEYPEYDEDGNYIQDDGTNYRNEYNAYVAHDIIHEDHYCGTYIGIFFENPIVVRTIKNNCFSFLFYFFLKSVSNL